MYGSPFVTQKFEFYSHPLAINSKAIYLGKELLTIKGAVPQIDLNSFHFYS